jgi:hypothetical protein
MATFNDQAVHLMGKVFNVGNKEALLSADYIKALVEELAGNLREDVKQVFSVKLEDGLDIKIVMGSGYVNFRSYIFQNEVTNQESASAFIDIVVNSKTPFWEVLGEWKKFVRNFEAKNNTYSIQFRA